MSTLREPERSARGELTAADHSALGSLAELASGEVAASDFLGKFLAQLSEVLQALAGYTWTSPAPGTLTVSAHTGQAYEELLATEEDRQTHGRLIEHFWKAGRAGSVRPQTRAPGEVAVGNPTTALIVLGVIRAEDQPLVLVEFFVAGEFSEADIRRWLRLVELACEQAARGLAQLQQRELVARQDLWSKLEEFSQAVHCGLDSTDVSYQLANEGRRIIGCDRVTVATWNGRTCRLRAISGQDTFDSRANQIKLLTRLATVVAKADEPLWYTGETVGFAPQLEAAVGDYVDEAHTANLGVLPLRRPRKESDTVNPPLLGVLIIEQMSADLPLTVLQERATIVAKHGGGALANAATHESLFLMPVWRTLGKTRWVTEARQLPWTITIGSALLVLLLALLLIRVDFTVESKGTLEPVVKRDIFAPHDGIVSELYAEHGQVVAQDALLMKLYNTDLNVQITGLEGRFKETLSQVASLNRSRGEAGLKDDERQRIAGQVAEKQATLASIEQQLKSLRQRQSDMAVHSPLAGQVVTWQVHERLAKRPVQRGQVLVTVADLESAWELELNVPESQIGHVIESQNSLGAERPVTFILASRPGQTFTGTIQSVHTTADVHGEDGNTVLMRVKINKDALPAEVLRPGVTVTAKVNCGRSSLGYAWLHDFFGWVSKMWFKL